MFSVVFVSCWFMFGLIAIIECCEACSVVWFVIGYELLVVCIVVVRAWITYVSRVNRACLVLCSVSCVV